MYKFDQHPGSWLARRMGCTCGMPTRSYLRADPDCPIHGVTNFKRMPLTPGGKMAIERFRRRIERRTLGEPWPT